MTKADIYATLLPPLSNEEAEWIYEITKSESEYYKIRSAHPGIPNKGTLLLERKPYTSEVKVVWPNGDNISRPLSKTFPYLEVLRDYGITLEQSEKAINYIWNFGRVYVRANPDTYQAHFKTP